MTSFLTRAQTSPVDMEEGSSYEVTDSGNSSMKVVVRVRPESEVELRSSCQCVIKVLDEHVLVFDPAGHSTSGNTSSTDNSNKKPFGFSSPSVSRFFGGRRLRPLLAKKHKDLRFAFDHVFDETSSQTQVFHHTTQSILEGVLDGINCSVFAYGATGAGKTHTMLGQPEDPGVIFQTMMELYRRIDALKSTKTCRISVSYCEVYNETICDLLVPSGPLNLREDPLKGLVVSGLSSHTPQTAEELLSMLERGNGNRTQHPTEANATSSRSHAVFQVYVEQRPRTADLSTEVTQAKMSLIDLAGSERATVTSNRGARLREGANINRSLLALGNCINALASNKGKAGYVPYRDSKLTRLLKDSLGGNCRTVMVANISPSALCYEDTYNTLKYADRAKQIKTTLVRNVLQVDYHMTRYKTIIMDLRKEIAELKMQTGQSSPGQDTFDPKEASRLCELVGSVYGERGRLRKHMAELDAKEREALLKVCRKERDLQRIDLLGANATKKPRIRSRLEALRHHLEDIQREKQTVNEYLFSNNESVGRIQGEINAACRDNQAGGGTLQQLLEAVVDARKLEVENSHQWSQTKHLLKYIKNQEREIARTERMLCLALSLIQRQQSLLRSNSVDTTSIRDDLDSLTHLADGDKGVVWADQTRISTNDLHDVSTSSFSLTQQQLFDCFLEHSSPRMRRGGVAKNSPKMSTNSLGILTSASTTHNTSSKEDDLERTLTPTLSRQSSWTTPTSRSNTSTLTLRTCHTISSPSKSSDPLSSSTGSLRVTTDVCFSSDGTSEEDDISEVSSSGVGSYTTSEPSQSDSVDYDKLEKMQRSCSENFMSSLAQRTRTPTYDIARPRPPATPTYIKPPATTPSSSSQPVYGRHPIGTAFSVRTGNQINSSSKQTASISTATQNSLGSHTPQPYSVFQPLKGPTRTYGQFLPAPPPTTTSTSSSSHSTSQQFPTNHSSSTDSGIGTLTTIPRQRGGQLVIPNRPLANGFMVRSSPSHTTYSPSRFNTFEDNFVSPRQMPGTKDSSHVIKQSGHVTTTPMKAPIGAFSSPFQKVPHPFPARVMATPNPYVKAPSLAAPRPPSVTSINSSHTYQSIEIPSSSSTTMPRKATSVSPPLTNQQTPLSKSTALSGSKSSMVNPDEGVSDTHGLNSTFTVEVEVAKGSQRSTSNAPTVTVGKGSIQKQTIVATDAGTEGKRTQGRGMFSKNRNSVKLPSYLKMTKSAESKKVNRVQNKENVGQMTSTSGGAGGGLRFKRFNLNRSRDQLNGNGGPAAPIALATRYSSAPQLAC